MDDVAKDLVCCFIQNSRPVFDLGTNFATLKSNKYTFAKNPFST